MVAKLRIPAQHVKPLGEFVQLTSDEQGAFIRAIEKQQPTLSLDDLGERLAAASGLDSSRIHRILEVLVSLHAAREGLNLSLQEFIAELLHAMDVLENSQLKPADRELFETSIKVLLAPDSPLALTSKALTVMNEHSNVYLGGRVLTDLRPVFGSSVEEAPAALVAVHNLKISYRHNHDLSEFFVAMDNADIVELMDVLGRALKKEQALRHFTNEKQVNLLEVKP
jgi:hypothetical protein